MDTRLVDGLGLWFERSSTSFEPGRPALFLDRDGVIVEETHYLGRAEDVRMIARAAAAIACANLAGLPVVVITNQAGIGRGYYGWGDFIAVQDRICENLAAAGAHVDVVLACAYHEAGQGDFAQPHHPWRKPSPGMILAAADTLALDLGRSMVVGDKISDLEAGRNAGVGRGVLVESGHGRTEIESLSLVSFSPMFVTIARDIGEAIAQVQSMPFRS